MWRVMTRLVRGDAELDEVDTLLDVTYPVEGHTICALGDAAPWPIQGLLRHFRPAVERRIREHKQSRAAAEQGERDAEADDRRQDRKSTRMNSSHEGAYLMPCYSCT